MECNRDEAERAKEIAEKKFLAKDVAGAKKFAIKAQSLYPRINGISQLLATIDVFIYADNKINGEVDWYGVLGVNPLDTEDVIRKKYRKLVLMLHPDKNKANGANGAFLLVTEAWELLSDKTKRSAYDRITSLHRSQHNVQPQCYGSAKPAAEKNGFPNSTKGSDIKVPKDNSSSVRADFHKKKTDSNDSPKPPNVPPPSRNEQSAVPPSSHKQKPANASVPPPHEYKPDTVPPSSYRHDRCTAPPHEYKPDTVPPSSYRHDRRTAPPHEYKPDTVPPSSYRHDRRTAPPHEYKPDTVPPSSYRHDRRTAPPFSSYKEKSSTFPQSPKHKPSKKPGSYYKKQNPPQKPQQTASFLSACHECKNQYYCPIIYINQDLLCRDCFNEVFHGRKPF